MPYEVRNTEGGDARLWAYRDGSWFRLSGIEPLSKLQSYRKAVSELYCPSLKYPEGLSAVTGCLVLPSASTQRANALFGSVRDALGVPPRWLAIGGRDALSRSGLHALLPDTQWESSLYMNADVAADLRNWLVEPEFSAEQRDRPVLDAAQSRLATTRTETGYRRIWGPAGSGKTSVLAKRAALLEQQGMDVLVVSYNITLLNYLRDAADVRRPRQLHYLAALPRLVQAHDDRIR